MSTAEKVRSDIRKMKPGTVFLVSDLEAYKESKSATTKALAYFMKKDEKNDNSSIGKIADGLFYKVEKSRFGNLPPSYREVIQALTYKNKRKVGYTVGPSLFNMKGLSTQVPSVVTIITSKNAPHYIDAYGIKIEVKRTKETVREKDIARYELEYILNNISKIQDFEGRSLSDSLEEYIQHIVDDSRNLRKLYKHLSYKKTKALFGAILDDYQEKHDANFEGFLTEIRNDLSRRSHYRLGSLSRYIKNKDEWNIKF